MPYLQTPSGTLRNTVFLARNRDVLYILMNTDERTGFYVIVTTVFYQVLDCLSCAGTFLNFIKDDNGFTFMERYQITLLQLRKDII